MYPLAHLAQLVGGVLEGPGDLQIRGIAPIEEAGSDQISLAADKQYIKLAASTKAGALLVSEELTGVERPTIRVKNPRLAFITLLEAFAPGTERRIGVDERALLAGDVRLGNDISIGPFVTVGEGSVIGDNVTLHAGVRIGKDVRIGDNTTIYPNAVIYDRTQIGSGVIVHANAVIGSDGYGFVTTAEGHLKVPHIGRVEIGDDVEIGACVTVDRATCGVTRIGRGTKIGNLTQVAHNVQIGEETLVAGMAGLAGSCKVGSRVTLAGQVGVVGHIEVGDHVVVGAQSLVAKSIPPGTFVSGTPAREHKEMLRAQAASQHLPDLMREVREMRSRLKQLEELLDRNETEPTQEAEG